MIFELILDISRQYRKLIVVTILLLSVIGISIFSYLAITRSGKMAVEVHVAPSDATITVRSKQGMSEISDGTAYLKPGDYTVTVEKSGYEKYTIEQTFDDSRNIIVASLVPVSDEAKKWMQDHQDEYKENEKYGSRQAQQRSEVFFANNPLTTQLPYQDPYYQIGYKNGKDGNAVITVSTESPRYRYFAIKKIQSMGYDIADYKIEFTNYKNPLESK